MIFQKTILQNPYIKQKPFPKQAKFLLLDKLEALFGGAAGPGKSSALLMAALQYVGFRGYSALILRRTYRDLALPGALMDRAKEWLSGSDARWNEIQHCWTFPSGAKIQFGYLESEADKYRYQGAEFHGVFPDEITQFSESQYTYMFSRLRKLEDSPIPLRMWGASNPGGVGHNWVKQRFIVEGEKYGRAFVPATLKDNPAMDAVSYTKSLANLDPITRMQLLEGNWEVKETFMFKRSWLVGSKEYPDRCIVEPSDVPENLRLVRVWDFAKTPEGGSGNPDFTAGLKMGLSDGVFYILDLRHFRGSPQQIERAVRDCAGLDGLEVSIYIEEENGAAGKNLIDQYQRNVLLGYVVKGVKPTGAKTVRAMPFASACEAGNVRLVRGIWNNEFLDELEMFPNGDHDDCCDVAAYAANILASELSEVAMCSRL